MCENKNLNNIVEFIDNYLDVKNISDYPQAFNGLQIENSGKISKISCAVDASLESIKKTAENNSNLLIVHHGLFWQKERRIINSDYKKIKLLIENDIALYSSHLPLDIHKEIGNNKLLCDTLKIKNRKDILENNGVALGIKGEVDYDFNKLVALLEKKVISKKDDLKVYKNRSDISIETIGVSTGGAGEEIIKASKDGVDTFITGEGSHWTFSMAQELGINLIYAGHYNTEVFGVKALSDKIKAKFNLNWEFIDLPSGL